jgi:hypothetical protein
MQLEKEQRERNQRLRVLRYYLEKPEAFETVKEKHKRLAASSGPINQLVAWAYAQKGASVEEVSSFLLRVFGNTPTTTVTS